MGTRTWSRRAFVGTACAWVATAAAAQDAAPPVPAPSGDVGAPLPPPPAPLDPALAALRAEARALETLVAQAQGVPFTIDPEDTIVVLGGVVELSVSETPRGRALGVCMGRIDGVFDATTGDITVQCHSFIPLDTRPQSALLVGMDVPMLGFATAPGSGVPQAWMEAKDVLVGARPRGGRAVWRADGRMFGSKPGRVIVGPINGHWTPLAGGRLVVQGAWAVREGVPGR